MKLSQEVFGRAMRFATTLPNPSLDFRNACVWVGRPQLLEPEKDTELLGYLRAWKPWRKGPFNIYGHRIDANWQSDQKWERLKRILRKNIAAPPESLRICDVGCNNGYFLFALKAEFAPKRLLGLDPTEEFYQCFRFIQNLGGQTGIEYLPYGFQELIHFPNYFDVIVCMGVFYHYTDPVHLLRLLHASMRKGGLLVLESLSIPAICQEDAAYALVPSGRYAGMRGVWQVPRAGAIQNLLRRTAFGKICLIEEHSYTDEQRRTEWGNLPSLQENIDPKAPEKTIEGYPAPRRAWFTARKG